MRTPGGSPHSSEVLTLADLIQARRDERGWSYRTLAARADHVLSAARWQQLGTNVRIKEFPEPATIRAMSDALEVDVASVVLAAAASIGLDVRRRQPELATMLPSVADQLTAEQRDAVLAVVRAMVPKETVSGSADEDEPKPGTEAGRAQHGGAGGQARQGPMSNEGGTSPLSALAQASTEIHAAKADRKEHDDASASVEQ